MANLQSVAARNNLGVAYLEAGDMRKALDYFSEALMFTMGDPSLHGIIEVPLLQYDAANLSQRILALLPESDFFVRTKAGLTPRRVRALPSSVSFAYTRGINLIPCHGAYSADPFVNTSIASSIIIFNLSIVYHLQGLEGCDSSGIRLLKARSLYQRSQKLLDDAGVPLCATGNPVIDVLSMALFNNLAHVSFEMGGFEETRRYFDRLIRFALTVVPARYGDTYVATLLDQQKSNLLLNAIILQAPKFAAAA